MNINLKFHLFIKMKLILKNFKCYDSREFIFADSGLSLITGNSGSGKSSILQAIYFALYGTGSKIVKFGEKSCRVELYIEGLKDGYHIVRTKGPNRLIVNDIYEDISAQEIINQEFGNSYNITGYISQNAVNSFIHMSPIEKLSFLEKFTFSDIDLSSIKKRSKDLIKEKNDNLVSISSQLELATGMVDQIENPGDIIFPLNNCPEKYMTGSKGKEYRDKLIKNENTRLKNTQLKIKKEYKVLRGYQLELKDVEILEAKIVSKSCIVKSLIKKLELLSSSRKEINYIGDKCVQELESQLNYIRDSKKLFLLQSKIDKEEHRIMEMEILEIDEYKKEIDSIDNMLWKEYSKLEASDTINQFEEIEKDMNKIREYKSRIKSCEVDDVKFCKKKDELIVLCATLDEKKKRYSKLQLQQDLYTCPSCNNKLKFKDDELCLFKDYLEDDSGDDLENVSKEIKDLEKYYKVLSIYISKENTKAEMCQNSNMNIKKIKEKYDEDVSSFENIKDDIIYIKDYRITQNNLQRQYDSLKFNIKNRIFSGSLEKIKGYICIEKEQVIKLKGNVYNDKFTDMKTEQELHLIIQDQKMYKSKLSDNKISYDVTESEKCEYESDISMTKKEHNSKYNKEKSITSLNIIIKDSHCKLLVLKEDLQGHEKNIDGINIYQEWEKNKNTWDKWTDKIDILKEKEILSRKEYASATLLKEVILEAESISMINIISSINTHAQTFLDEFFSDHPISVQLQPFKESKTKNKPQINLAIEYRGMEADVGMLSGGELARVTLAYTLALAEIYNTPIIMLDECTSSLDQDLTTEVMDCVRTQFGDKLIISVCHQVIKGMFDNVIEL
jgi:exonuclease SbcC